MKPEDLVRAGRKKRVQEPAILPRPKNHPLEKFYKDPVWLKEYQRELCKERKKYGLA